MLTSLSSIFKADKEGYIDGYIVCPPTIYGVGSGPVNRASIQVPILIKAFIKAKKGFWLNTGTSVWNNVSDHRSPTLFDLTILPQVHIDDLIDFYLLLIPHSLTREVRAQTSTPYSKFYFVSADTHVWGELARNITKLLHKHGLLPSGEAESMPFADAIKIDQMLLYGACPMWGTVR